MSIPSTGSSHDPGTTNGAKPISVTVQDACRITGVGLTTMYDLIKQGRIETFKIGRRTLIKYTSLEALAA